MALIHSFTIAAHIETDNPRELEEVQERLRAAGASVQVDEGALMFSLTGARPDNENFDLMVHLIENASQGEISGDNRRTPQ